MTEFPNDLFAGGRRVLGRYGYRPEGGTPDWPVEWARLKPDFPFVAPDWQALSGPQRAAAVDYLTLRLEADRRLEACETAHADVLAAGIGTELVERYAAARESYEDSVEAFGAARARLQMVLAEPSSP